MKLSKHGVASTSALACILVLGLKVWDSRAQSAPTPVVQPQPATPRASSGSTKEAVEQAYLRRKQRLVQLAQARDDSAPAQTQVDWEKYEADLEDEEFDDRDPVEKVQEEVALLERQHPMEFMRAFASSPGQPEVDEAARAAAERHVGHYVEARTARLKKMYVDYVENPFYEPQRDVSALLELDQEYERDIADLREKLPGIEGIPQVFRETALPPPFFAKDAWDELQPPAAPEIIDLRHAEAQATEQSPSTTLGDAGPALN